MNQCCVIINWTLVSKLLWNLNQNTKLFIHKNAFENVVWEMVAILFRGRWVNLRLIIYIFVLRTSIWFFMLQFIMNCRTALLYNQFPIDAIPLQTNITLSLAQCFLNGCPVLLQQLPNAFPMVAAQYYSKSCPIFLQWLPCVALVTAQCFITHLLWTEWPPFRRWKNLYFDLNFTEVCS